ncbi:MAG TPA: AAA family ATPase [Acidobacteriota bacterium]|nr:AAA family ATPase [Acidobacteriota bacterium]
MNDWSKDLVLRVLADLPDPIGSLVQAYPGRRCDDDDQTWLHQWFEALIQSVASGCTFDIQLVGKRTGTKGGGLSKLARPLATKDVRLLSIEPHYFRGFRKLAEPLNVDADLIVVEGPNSSGKTSISEAIEWLLTGELSRRQAGNPRELKDLISNQFRPGDESTWVEMVFSVDNEHCTLRRVLERDYAALSKSLPKSRILRNGKDLSPSEWQELLSALFAGIAPLLMQHTLGEFIRKDPKERREYFEELLQIDELTGLIEKAIIGDATLKEFPPPKGEAALSRLESLVQTLDDPLLNKDLAQIRRTAERGEISSQFESKLLEAARRNLDGLDTIDSFHDCRRSLESRQEWKRQEELPLLVGLRELAKGPTITIETFDNQLQRPITELTDALASRQRMEHIAKEVDTAKRILARAADELAQAGFLSLEATEPQVCPLCLDQRETLSPARLSDLADWKAQSRALDVSQKDWEEALTRLDEAVSQLGERCSKAASALPSKSETKKQIARTPGSIRETASRTVGEAQEYSKELKKSARALDSMTGLLRRLRHGEDISEAEEEFSAVTRQLQSGLSPSPSAERFRGALKELEQEVGASAEGDPEYLVRQRWLDAADARSDIKEGMRWERARLEAQRLLKLIRGELIKFRSAIIEDKRQSFSGEMARVWNLLRKDTGIRFHEIEIPKPRGKGFKLAMAVKALLTDGTTEAELDALRVFSESQVNVIGLAAFITRARLLGHAVLVFDDPVQSMDREHFRTFAAELLPVLLDKDGVQIVLLTHNDEFARDISHHHYRRPSRRSQVGVSRRLASWRLYTF